MECAVRCPYCVPDVEFRRMVAHVDGRHICNRCGLTSHLGAVEYECRYPNCLKLVPAVRRFRFCRNPPSGGPIPGL
jgi:hypothetical protein